MLPKITVVTVTYNCVGDVEDTILSVIGQNYPNLEYIVVDGNSKDGTLSIINRYKHLISVVVSEPDKGVYDAMNKALKLASGEWCGFMNAGDTYASKDVLTRLFDGVKPESSIRVLYGNTSMFYPNGSRKMHNTVPVDRLKWAIMRYQPYTHQAVFYNITCKDDCLYDIRYKYAADYDVACRYWKKYGVKAYVYKPITVCNYKDFNGLSSCPANEVRIKKEYIQVKIRSRLSVVEIVKDCIRLLLRYF